jgi:phage baseplate assembly protein W
MENDKGLSFPFKIDPQTGGVSWCEGREKIRQNIRVILGTRLGERPMIRSFGTRIHALVQEPNDNVLRDIIQRQAQQAITNWEPRVVVTAAELEQGEAQLQLRLDYIFTEGSNDEPLRVNLG